MLRGVEISILTGFILALYFYSSMFYTYWVYTPTNQLVMWTHLVYMPPTSNGYAMGLHVVSGKFLSQQDPRTHSPDKQN
jgi:hypothetical protein